MFKNKECKISSCLSTHRREIVGGILLLLATLLTLLTLSGTGILGMFIAGLVLCSHRHLGCKKCCCSDVDEDDTCPTTPKRTTTTKKATKTS